MSQIDSVAPRRPRRTEQETARLVLDSAVEHVARHGLRVSLDLPMEEVIAAADVARATAYRLWPTREVFLADVLDRLAEGQTLPTLAPAELETVVREVEAALTPRTTALEAAGWLMGGAVAREFDVLVDSDAWAAYLAFEAVVASTPDSDRRARLLARVAEVEAGHLTRVVELFGGVARALGLRSASPDALGDAAHSARVLARGLGRTGVRAEPSGSGRASSRRRLATGAAALFKDALRPEGRDRGGLPGGWADAVRAAIVGHERARARQPDRTGPDS